MRNLPSFFLPEKKKKSRTEPDVTGHGSQPTHTGAGNWAIEVQETEKSVGEGRRSGWDMQGGTSGGRGY